MAITTTAVAVSSPLSAKAAYNVWAVCATSADARSTEEIKAAVTGKAHYLELLSITSATAGTVTIGSGEAAGAVEAVLLGPIPFAATSGEVLLDMHDSPIQLTAAKSLTVNASALGDVCVFAKGFTL